MFFVSPVDFGGFDFALAKECKEEARENHVACTYGDDRLH